MLLFDPHTNLHVIDPHYLTIKPLKKIWDEDKSYKKEIAIARLMWLYHMYNPHSPFRDYRNTTKSMEIVRATFPAAYLQKKEDELKALIEDANRKNKDLSESAVEKDGEIKKVKLVEVPELKIYDPEFDEEMQDAIKWYASHLQQTPLWKAYEAYKEGIYNLAKVVADPNKTAQEIRTASQELDTLPLKMERMRQQAVKDEAQTLKTQGDKNIKRSERLPTEKNRKSPISG